MSLKTNKLQDVDRGFLSIGELTDQPDDDQYWFSKSPSERLKGLEATRQTIYGYRSPTQRLQRVLEVARLKAR